MISKPRQHVIYAGLGTLAVVICPQSAWAVSLDFLPTNPLLQSATVLLASFIGGGVIGWVITKIFIAKDGSLRFKARNKSAVISANSTAATQDSFHNKTAYVPKHMKCVQEIEVSLTSNYADSSNNVAESHHKAVNLEDIADKYVKKQQDKKSKAIRKLGVGQVLAKRLGLDADSFMSGIPVIQRADGTVGDVGTSWWDSAVEGHKRHGEGFSEYLHMDEDWTANTAMNFDGTADPGTTAASIFVQTKPQSDVHEKATACADNVDTQKYASRPHPLTVSRSEFIAQVVPAVTPEQEQVRGSKEDIWNIALAAMDEQIIEVDAYESIADFNDMIGDETTLDDPDGLELATNFIPFKAPEGHPEIKDTDSYIDYLISSEFARVRSKTARKSAREYLKVIEGGTSSRKAYVPEHFKCAREA